MATRNIVPRDAREGSLGTQAKPWGSMRMVELFTEEHNLTLNSTKEVTEATEFITAQNANSQIRELQDTDPINAEIFNEVIQALANRIEYNAQNVSSNNSTVSGTLEGINTTIGNIQQDITNINTAIDSENENDIQTRVSSLETAETNIKSAIDFTNAKSIATRVGSLESDNTTNKTDIQQLQSDLVDLISDNSDDITLITKEVNIAAVGWSTLDNSTDDYSDFKQYLDIAVTEATNDTVPILTILPQSLAVADKAGFSPVCRSMNGVLRVYVKDVPESVIKANLVLLIRPVTEIINHYE